VDLQIIVQSFNDSMAKLLAIEGAISGLSPEENLARVLQSHYGARLPDKNATKGYIDFMYKRGGFSVSNLVHLIYPNWLRSAGAYGGGGSMDHLKGLSILDAYDTTIADDAPSKGKESKNFETILESILGKVADSGKTINSLDVGNINNDDFIGITPLALGGIATIPTLTYIAEAGSNEAVIPLNERGVEFMKKTMLSALRSLNDGEISKLLTESEISENRIEKKVDSLSDNIRLLVQSISSNRSSNTVVENGSPDIVSDFTKMLASGVIGNRNGGI